MTLLEHDPLARGRSRAERTTDGLRIVIPAKREWPMLVFLMFWLGGWTAGGVAALTTLLNGHGDAFLVFWLGGWACGMAFAVCVLGWGLLGREIVLVTRDALVVTRKAGPYEKTKRFSGTRVERLRADGYEGLWRTAFFGPRTSWRQGLELWGLGGGSIVFDYGARTHRFASKLDEAESRQLVEAIEHELGRH